MAAKQPSVSAQSIRDRALGEGAESTAASLVLQILHASEGELEDFREINLGEDCNLDLQYLHECRELLLVLGLALRSPDEALWMRVRESWKQIFWDEGVVPAADPQPSPAADAAQEDAAQDGDAPSPPGGEPSATLPEPEMLNRPAASAPAEPQPVGAPAAAPPPPAMTPPELPIRSQPWQGSGLAPAAAPAPPAPPQPPLASRVPEPPPPARAAASGPSGTVDDDTDPEAQVLSTASLGDVSPLAGALPFASPDDSSASRPDPVAAQEPGADTGETAALGAISPLAGMLPFAGERSRPSTGVHAAMSAPDQATASGQPPAPPMELTVEQYAALCATSELPAAERSRTEAQYGLRTPQDRQILDAHWGARLAADSALKQKFDALLDQYRAWHRSQR